MGQKKSKSSSNISPEANPENGRDVNVILPNQSSTLNRIYAVQAAGELKIACLQSIPINPDTIEVILIFPNGKEVILDDKDDFGERLHSLEHIELRTKNPTGNELPNNQDIMNALHFKNGNH